MSGSPWDPTGTAGGSDPLADALTGVVSRARHFRAVMDAVAPPTSAPPGADGPSPAVLAVLGLLSACERIEALFGDIPDEAHPAGDGPPGGARAARGSLLR